MKKTIAIILAVSAVLALAACTNNAVQDMTTTMSTTASAPETTQSTTKEMTTQEMTTKESVSEKVSEKASEILDGEDGKVSDTEKSIAE